MTVVATVGTANKAGLYDPRAARVAPVDGEGEKE
jgi:hypothetical protein